MTRGAEPRYADTQYAQWIRRQLEERNWHKQDLALALQEASNGRLGDAGATQLVLRATKGNEISRANRELLASVLGAPEEVIAEEQQQLRDRQEETAAGLLALTREVRRLARRVRALEQPARPKTGRGGKG